MIHLAEGQPMEDTTNFCAQPVQDAVFAGIASGAADGSATATLPMPGNAWQADPGTVEEADDRPEVRWLRQERVALEEELDEALAALRQRHNGILGLHYRCEKERVLAFQELSRQTAVIEADRAGLAEREADVARRVAACEARSQELATAQETIPDLQAQAEALEQAARPRRQELEELRTLIGQAETELETVRQQVAIVAEEIAAKRCAIEAERTALGERRRQTEQRGRHVEKAEESLQRRLREWEEFESRSRAELQRLAEERARAHARLAALANNPELRSVVIGWSTLPEHVRRTVLMLVMPS